MNLSPTEIFNDRKLFLIGSTGFLGKVTLSMLLHSFPNIGRVYVTVRMSRVEAVFMIRDEGPGFDPASLPDPTDPANLERVSGRGLLLIQTFMDKVEHNETGNQITMVKRRYS